MNLVLIPSVFGILAIDQSKVITTLFHNRPTRELAEIYVKLQKGTVPGEMEKAIQTLQSQGYDTFYVEDPAYITALQSVLKLTVQQVPDISKIKALRAEISKYFGQIGASTDTKVILEKTKALSEFMVKLQIAEISTQHDLHIKQAVDTLTDTNKTINILATRLREWYGLHFPELTDKLVDDHQLFTQIIADFGTRDQFKPDQMEKNLKLPQKIAEDISDKAMRSMGGLLDVPDVKIIQGLASRILELFHFRVQLENYISDTLDNVAPNLKAVLGASVASMLIGIAGSLEKLANFPSSTIQVLGAEKALFKALKFGAKTPKHGVLFQWHKIRSQKVHIRGKISRLVAGKVSILAKVDYYKGTFIGDAMSKEIDEKIELIKKTFPQAKTKKVTAVKKFDGAGEKTGGKPDFSKKNKQFSKSKDKAHFKSKKHGGHKDRDRRGPKN